MGSEGGTGAFWFVCLAEMTRLIHKTAGRGPAGGVHPQEVPRLKGRLRMAYYLYSQGVFARAAAQLEKLAGAGNLAVEEEHGISSLRAGI